MMIVCVEGGIEQSPFFLLDSVSEKDNLWMIINKAHTLPIIYAVHLIVIMVLVPCWSVEFYPTLCGIDVNFLVLLKSDDVDKLPCIP